MKEDIRQLLERFYRCEFTIDEERKLIRMLLSDDCPEDMMAERHAVISLARTEAIEMPEDFEQRLRVPIHNMRKRLAIAAAILLLLGLGFWTFFPKSKPETSQPIAKTEQKDSLSAPSMQEESAAPIKQTAQKLPKRRKGVRHSYAPQPSEDTKMPDPSVPSEIDLSAEISDILANIDQLEQQILETNPQNKN